MSFSQAKRWMVALSATLLLAASSSFVQAFDAFPVITDPNDDPVDGPVFGGLNVWADNPPYAFDDTAVSDGNDLLVYSWGGMSGSNGMGFSASISNGENGIDMSLDGVDNTDENPDVSNTEPVNSAIAAANGGGKLQNGNVIRFSAWMRQDPVNPVTAVPQVEMVLKAEFWKEALSENQDSNPNQIQPFWGDKIFDVDQHGGTLGIDPDSRADWVDIDNDGNTAFGLPVSATLTTDAWTLVEHVHTVNDADWFGIDDDVYTVADVEDVRLTMFVGDWSGGSLGDLSAIWVDNIWVEVFADADSVTLNENPMPMPGIPGDFDGDSDVDGNDFLVWQEGFGTIYDGNDFLTWQENFPTPGSGGGSGAVPEPASGAIALLVALIGIYWRRR